MLDRLEIFPNEWQYNPMSNDQVKVLITYRLAAEYVNRIRAVDPRIRVLYEPELLGELRYATDHSAPVERTPAQEARWQELLAQAEVMFGFDYTHLYDLLQRAPRLKWVQGTSTGIGQAVKRFGWDKSDVVFTTAGGVHPGPLAEFCVMAMLMFVKDAFRMAAEKERKHWERYAGTELRGKTLAVIGLGRNGREVARLARCLGMRVIGTKRNVEGFEPTSLGVERLYPWTGLHPMLSRADFVALCVPHTQETEGLVGEAEIAAMKPGAVLINVARGTIWDEPAVVRALQSGDLGGVASDVFVVEPLNAESPFWDMSNVIICPNSASAADSENAKLTALLCDNLRRYLANEPLRNVLDTERLY
jgi:phosphoglycerate dehydrogenase-like enzyme